MYVSLGPAWFASIWHKTEHFATIGICDTERAFGRFSIGVKNTNTVRTLMSEFDTLVSSPVSLAQ
jgi:hypothetical protein